MGFLKDMLVGTEGAAMKKNMASAAWLKGMLGEKYAYGQDALLKGLTGIDAGFDQASGVLSQQGQFATNAILASKAQTDASNKQALLASGGAAGSMSQNLANQSQAMTAQSLGELGTQLGTAQAGLHVQKGLAKNQAFQSLADYAMGSVNTANNITPTYQGQPGAIGAIFQGVGQGLGQWAGGGF